MHARHRLGQPILPKMLDELFPLREAAKQRGDNVAAHAIKILMNSFYGVLGTPACRFSDPALANSITGMGKLLLLRMGLRHERNVADWCEEALDMLSALSHGTNVVPIGDGQRENNG